MSTEKKFWHTDVGKVLSHGIHDHSGANTSLGHWILMLNRIFEKDPLGNKEVLEYLSGMKIALKRQRDAIDYIYETLKKMEGF